MKKIRMNFNINNKVPNDIYISWLIIHGNKINKNKIPN